MKKAARKYIGKRFNFGTLDIAATQDRSLAEVGKEFRYNGNRFRVEEVIPVKGTIFPTFRISGRAV